VEICAKNILKSVKCVKPFVFSFNSPLCAAVLCVSLIVSIFDYEMESSGDTSHFDLCPEFLATADEIGREFIAKTTQNKIISDFNKFESFLGTKNLEKENLL